VPGGDGQPADGRGLWGETERGEAPPGSGVGFGGRRRSPVGAREARDLMARRGAEGDGQEGNAGGGTVAQPRRWPVGVRPGWGTGATGTEVSGAARRRRGVRGRGEGPSEMRGGAPGSRQAGDRGHQKKKKEKEKNIMARPHGRTDACTSTGGGGVDRAICRSILPNLVGRHERSTATDPETFSYSAMTAVRLRSYRWSKTVIMNRTLSHQYEDEGET
jgi:hypothetical protein